MSENDAETEKESTLEGGVPVRRLWREFDLVVLACILVLAVLLGVLNNLRVADERKVKWFGAPADRADQNATGEVAQ